MIENIEKVTIKKCPKCRKSHAFRVRVRRTRALAFAAAGGFDDGPLKERFTRTFTCPEVNLDFESKFWVTVDSGAMVKSVKILGNWESD